LLDLVVASADVSEASGRFERFAGKPSVMTRFGRALRLDRGQVHLTTSAAFASLFPDITVPRLPFLGAYAVRVGSLLSAEALLSRAGLPFRRNGAVLTVPFPAELGLGCWVFADNPADLPWRNA
jgi:hypothetical protein